MKHRTVRPSLEGRVYDVSLLVFDRELAGALAEVCQRAHLLVRKFH